MIYLGPSLNMLLPLDPSATGGKNVRGLRLFACACAERVKELLTDPAAREALEAGQQYAGGNISFERLQLAYVQADAVKVPAKRYRQPHHWAMIAATACAMVEVTAGPLTRGRTPEWAAVGAARIASCAASLAEQQAWFRSPEEIEEAQIILLRRYVPECFAHEN